VSDIPGHFADAVQLHRLANDMERIARGAGPSVGDLARCPVMLDWKLDFIKVPVLVGIVAGHPDVGPGLARTSQLFGLDIEGGRWARTLNNWYALSRGRADG